MTTMTKLMQFRTTYLRSIARAWTDKVFYDQLLEAPKSALADMGLPWPWEDVCDLEIRPTEDLQYISNEWVYSPDTNDSLTLYVPLDPKAIHEDDRALALADLYLVNSSLFSDTWGSPLGGDLQQTAKKKSVDLSGAEGAELVERLLAISERDGQGEGISLYPKAEEFAAFQVALLAAIAKAWEDELFRERLQVDFAGTVKALLSYSIPWTIVLHIKNDEDATWDGGKEKNKGWGAARWNFVQRNVLRLNFPSRPKVVSCQPAALAMYNATGAEYPFTCTC